MRRAIRIIGLTIVVLLLAAGASLYFSDSRVPSLLAAAVGIEAGAEELLTEAVGAEVTIESLNVSITAGEMTIRGLAVANPEGFHTEHAIEAGEVRVAMELRTLLEDTVVLREVTVERPLVTYELGPEGSNLEALRRNVESFAGSGDGRRRDTAGRAAGKRILIEDLYVRDGRVAASAVFLKGKSWRVPLPDMHLRNLSSGEGGVAAAGVVDEITSEITRNARRSVAPIRELAGDAGDRIAGRAAEVVEEARRKLEEGSGSAREALEQGSESARETLREKAETARETLEKGAESARKSLGEGAEAAREALERGTDSARQALGKGTEKVRKTLEKLLGNQSGAE